MGASLGVILAWLAIDATLPLVPQSLLPGLGGIVVDGRVMVFCLGLTVVSTLLVGLVQALRVSGHVLAKASRCTPAPRARRATVRASGCGRCWSPGRSR